MTFIPSTRLTALLTLCLRGRSAFRDSPVESASALKAHREYKTMPHAPSREELVDCLRLLTTLRDDAEQNVWLAARVLRDTHDLSERNLADLCGVSRTTLRTKLNSPRLIRAHAQALSIITPPPPSHPETPPA